MLTLPTLVAFSLYSTTLVSGYTSSHVSFVQGDVTQGEALPEAQFVVNLTEKVPRPSSKAKALRHLSKRPQPGGKTVKLEGSDSDQEYLTNIKFGEQSFKVIVDTGSSDTWLVHKGFNCSTLQGKPVPESTCAFGSSGYDPSKSKTFKPYPNRNFNISYGDGEFLTGVAGFETVSVGGLKVTSQEVGVATSAAWNGDLVSTGLMGLAYPGLTSVFKGTNPLADGLGNVEHYNPLFFNAIKQKAVSKPIFSVTLNRGSIAAERNSTTDPNLGLLAFGGIAPVPITKTSVTVPIQGTKISQNSSTTGFFFYTVDIDAYQFPGSEKIQTKGTAILDTGTTLLLVPTPVSNALAAAFNPPAVFSETLGGFAVDCNATAPPFAVVIGGTKFNVTAKDLILPIGPDDSGKQLCISGHADGGEQTDDNTFILGDTFLHNVVSTFDLKKNVVTLTERAPY